MEFLSHSINYSKIDLNVHVQYRCQINYTSPGFNYNYKCITGMDVIA